jgi:hypothetical protein
MSGHTITTAIAGSSARDLSSHAFRPVPMNGTGATGFSGDGGSAVKANMGLYPNGTALDSAGNLYITDTSNSVVRKVDQSTGVITINTIAGGNGGDGELRPVPRLWAIPIFLSLGVLTKVNLPKNNKRYSTMATGASSARQKPQPPENQPSPIPDQSQIDPLTLEDKTRAGSAR